MIYDIAIIGAGIAGLTAAIYARRAGKSVLMFEEKICGGQIMTTDRIKNYPGYLEIRGADLMRNVKKQALQLETEIRFEEVTKIFDDGGVKKIITEDGEYEAKKIILAVGRQEKKLGLEKEDVLTGVSYCATCDGTLYEEKTVAIVGGGNTALYDALYLADIAKKVYLIHRRNEFRADRALVEKVREKNNVEFVLNTQAVELVGEKKIEGVRVQRNDGKDEVLEVSGLFVAIGQRPKTERFLGLIDLDEKGYIVAGENCKTSAAGIYVAGDCRTKSLRQLVTAAADGAVAATEAVQELK